MSAGSPRIYDLTAARPEGWFEEVLEQLPDFERACQIIGRSTLGLALIAGARIASLTPSAVSQSNTLVEFSIGSDPTAHQVPLPEFRETVARQLLTPIEPVGLPDDPGVEALQKHIGGRYMLEAALFQIRPLTLRYDLGLSEIMLEFNGVQHVLGLEDFRDVMDERVRAELELDQADRGVAIDLGVVEEAARANANEQWGDTIAMLQPWLHPISMLLRTGEAQELTEQVRRRLSDGLDLLGKAYAHTGDLDAANEVLRIGVQWAGESDKAADLFLTLGQASIQGGNYGEAIGLLRRAIGLGAEQKVAMPLLAVALEARDQGLAAMVCLERARALGAHGDLIETVAAKLEARLAEAWSAFADWVRDTE